MEGKENLLKRGRSEEEPNGGVQTKVFVNQKLLDLNNPDQMRAVHERTKQLLFKGAASLEQSNLSLADANAYLNATGMLVGGTPTSRSTMAVAMAPPPSTRPSLLYQQYKLNGDGTIQICELKVDTSNPNLERRRSPCCNRETIVQDACINCTMPLCEECGYSCNECNRFICNSCITVFGNHGNTDQGLYCEHCQMFFT